MSKMSEMCTMSMNYNVDSNTKYSNYIEHRINVFELQQNSI